MPDTSLIGRASDVEAITALLQAPETPLVTLVGPGGVGKTRLARATAHAAMGAFDDGAVFVPLARSVSEDQVFGAIARSLGLRIMGDEPALTRVTDHLVAKHMLLVLDNFEHVVEASGHLPQIMRDSPNVTILVTSRIRLHLSGERVYPVAPLALSTDKGDPSSSPAVQLFLERMPTRAQQPPSDDVVKSVAEIVWRLDGLPLAIELAAARTAVLPPAALLQRLEQRLPLLSGGARDLPVRHRALRDTIAWSYDLLLPQARTLFCALSVFRGGFSLPAAERLGDAIGLNTLATIDALTLLMDHHLVQPQSDTGVHPRYIMYETVREFGWEKLELLGELNRIIAIHASVTLAGAEEAEPGLYGCEQCAWLDALEADQPNLRAAMQWAVTHDPRIAVRVACALARFWPIRGYLSESRAWFEQALAAAESAGAPVNVIGDGMIALAWIRYWQGSFAAGHALACDALERFRTAGELQGQANALRIVGHSLVGVAWVQDPPDGIHLNAAAGAMVEQLELWLALEHEQGAAAARHNLGFVALHLGQRQRATELLEEAVGRFADLGDRWSLALSLTYLAGIDLADNLARSARRLDQALAVYAELGDQWKVAYALYTAGSCLRRAQQRVEAAQLNDVSAKLLQRCGTSYFPAHATTPFETSPDEQIRRGATPERRPLTPEMAISQAREWLAPIARSEALPQTPGPRLTEREREVLLLLAQGFSDKRIAETLQISPRTVGGHISRLLAKLDVESRTAAAAYAVRMGLT